MSNISTTHHTFKRNMLKKFTIAPLKLKGTRFHFHLITPLVNYLFNIARNLDRHTHTYIHKHVSISFKKNIIFNS